MIIGMGDDEDEDNGAVEDESQDEEPLLTEEAELLTIPRNQFIDKIEKEGEKQGMTLNKNKIHFIADRLIEERKNAGETILLEDVEDYVLRYRQNQRKVFAFGQGNKKIFAFQKKP